MTVVGQITLGALQVARILVGLVAVGEARAVVEVVNNWFVEGSGFAAAGGWFSALGFEEVAFLYLEYLHKDYCIISLERIQEQK